MAQMFGLEIKIRKEIISSTGESFKTTCSPNRNGLTNKRKCSNTITSNKHRLRNLPVLTGMEETCVNDKRKSSPTAGVMIWRDQNKDEKIKSVFKVKRDRS
jgi:hypothetical protein